MRAKIEFVEMNGTATTVSVTNTRNRTAVVKVFSDGSRAVLSGGAWIVENLFRSGQRASDTGGSEPVCGDTRMVSNARIYGPVRRLASRRALLRSLRRQESLRTHAGDRHRRTARHFATLRVRELPPCRRSRAQAQGDRHHLSGGEARRRGALAFRKTPVLAKHGITVAPWCPNR